MCGKICVVSADVLARTSSANRWQKSMEWLYQIVYYNYYYEEISYLKSWF